MMLVTQVCTRRILVECKYCIDSMFGALDINSYKLESTHRVQTSTRGLPKFLRLYFFYPEYDPDLSRTVIVSSFGWAVPI